MTTEIANHITPATPDEATRMTASLRGLLHSPIRTMAEAAEVSGAVNRLSIPATKQWISGRVATLLSQYFASSVPSEMMAAIAEDWHEELKSYPAWALQNACRWWMGEDNPDRRKRPLAGDIAARARIEMGPVIYARSAVDRFGSGAGHEVKAEEPRVSPEAAADIVKRAGFAPRKFGGGNV